jgi:NAD(P)H-dependent FMN reductase
MDGNSQALTKAFIEGAETARHRVTVIDLAKLQIGACKACEYCRRSVTLGQCLQKDDMQQIYDLWFEMDAVVWATPLYYFSFSAQMKLALDRIYALPNQKAPNNKLQKMALLVACADLEPFAADGLVSQFHIICDYFGIATGGEVIARGVSAKGDIDGHPALKQAYRLGEDF